MAGNKTATDKLHDLLNPYFNTRVNPNWKAIVETIGDLDQDVADLVEEVRKQFFIATAYRPYLDTLGINVGVTRPKIVGMDDPTMRQYIPILSYQPKQVRQIIDDLLDLFFLHEATTAFAESSANENYSLKDGWELSYKVDGNNQEYITFTAAEFTNITSATAEEISASINRQALYSFAIPFLDRANNVTKVRIFSKSLGSRGSLEILGGRANIVIQFPNILDAGSGTTTVWNASKIDDDMTFTYVSGTDPNLYRVQAGDIVIIDIPGNNGSFELTNVDLTNNAFSFVNLMGTAETFNHGTTPGYFVRFLRKQKSVVFTRENRAVVWEISPGEVVVEIPATPPIVRRELKGSAHLNGVVGVMTTRISNSSLTISDASMWPISGQFILEPEEEIQTHILTTSENVDVSQTIHGRFDAVDGRFTYTGKTGNTLTGITPNLPEASGIYESSIASISRNGSNTVTVTTSLPNDFVDGQAVRILDVTGGSNFNTTQYVTVISNTQFTYTSVGIVQSGTGGTIRGEKIGLKDSGSKLYLTTAQLNTGIIGPYMYDTKAPFVVSVNTATLVNNSITAGSILTNIEVSKPNTIPNQPGYLIFDYGLETQEGPVKYLYKASEGVVFLDPSYVFQHSHAIGSGIDAIRKKGPQIMSGLGKEMAFYTTDPGAVRGILEDLIKDVKSVGVYLRFLVRFPKQYYSDYDVYGKTEDPLD